MQDNTPVRGGFREKFIIARYFLEGHGVEKSPELSIEYMKDAEEHITAVVGDGEAAKACSALGGYYKQLNEFKEAAHWYENAVRIDRGNPDAWNDLGECYDQAGRLADGIEASEYYIKAAFAFRRAINTGIAKGRRQKSKTALAAIEKKLEIIIKSHGRLGELAQYMLLDDGKKPKDMTDDELLKLSDAALEELAAAEPEAQYTLYERYADLDENQEYGAHKSRYMNWLKRAADGKYEPAIKRWKYITEGDPMEDARTFWQTRTKALNDVNNAYALYETGRSYLTGYGVDKSDIRKAISFFKKASRAVRSEDNDPYIAKAYFLLGKIYTGAYYDKDDSYYKNNYHRQFEPENAEKCLSEVLAIDKTNKNALYELCTCYEGRYGFDKLYGFKDNIERLRFYYNEAIEAGFGEDEKFHRFKGVIAKMEIMQKEIEGLF